MRADATTVHRIERNFPSAIDIQVEYPALTWLALKTAPFYAKKTPVEQLAVTPLSIVPTNACQLLVIDGDRSYELLIYALSC